MHEKRFNGKVERLRAPERVALLEVERVVSLSLEGAELKTVLDMGVGSGLFAESFDRHGLKVAGLDVNPEMISAARQFVPEGDFRQGIVEDVPYPDNSFDLVFFGLVLHEADEPLKALQEARRVLRKRVCILEWPYRGQEFGPPLGNRLNPIIIAEMAQQAGYTQLESTLLDQLVFYRLTV
jgi:ubiquinone/menaquinone biosynthesis C-methylase UbiE